MDSEYLALEAMIFGFDFTGLLVYIRKQIYW